MKRVVLSLMTQVQRIIPKALRRSRLPWFASLFATALLVAVRLPVLAQLPPPAQIAPSVQPPCSDPMVCYNQGRFEQAREIWEKAANTAAQAGDRLTEIRNRINAAQALKALGAFPRAEETLSLALTQLDSAQPNSSTEQLDGIKLRVKILRSLGDIYQAIGKIDEARTQLNDSLKLIQTNKDRLDKTTFNQEISETFFNLGVAERSEISRILPRALTFRSITQQSDQLQDALAFVDLLQPGKKPLSANVQQALLYFQAANENATNPFTTLKSKLNQLGLITEVLPRLNTLLTDTLSADPTNVRSLTSGIVDSQAEYFLTNALKVSSLTPQFKSLLPFIRTVQSQNPPSSELEFWVKLQDETVDLTQKALRLLAETSTQLATLPPSIETINSRLQAAQSIFRLQQVWETAQGNPQAVRPINGLEPQLRVVLKRVLETVKQAYENPQNAVALQAKFPQVRRVWPLLAKNLNQSTLFLPEATRRTLQNSVQNSLDMAAKMLTQARIDAHALNNQRAEASAYVALAEVYSKSGELNPTNAIAWMTVEQLSAQALALVQNQDAPDVVLRAQRLYAKALTKQPGKTQLARSACQVAASSLQANRANFVAIAPDVQFSFIESIEPFYRECVTALLPIPNQEDITQDEVQKNLENARKLIEGLQLAELDNFFREACVEGKNVAIDDVINRQSSPNTAVIYPIILSQQQIGVIARIPNIQQAQDQQKLLYFQPPALKGAETLDKFLLTLNQQLQDGVMLTAAQANSKILYDWIITPWKKELTDNKIKTLVFVLDGAFRNIPMAALYSGSVNQYLIDEYAVAISPGLQLTDPKGTKPQDLKALGGGLTEVSAKVSTTEPFPKDIIEKELAALKTFGVLREAPIFGKDFVAQNLETRLKKQPFNLVHLSTHGIFSSRQEDTYIVMADARLDINQFSDLFRAQRRAQDSAIELLILSACETAGGDSRAALGLTGVAIKAGVRSTVASLWAIPSETTAVFIDQFYKALIEKQETKAQAIRTAQLAIKKNNNPNVWGAFVLVGNWL
jgi:CHAT domain-containing protein/tetratricopeptide (TPR) repeat protein